MGNLVLVANGSSLSYDDFKTAKTKVKQTIEDLQQNKQIIKLPMYSNMIVVEDYKAYEAVNRLTFRYGIEPLQLVMTNENVDLAGFPYRIYLGGPRSNYKLRELLERDDIKTFFSLNHPAGALENWRLMIHQPEELSLAVNEYNGIGIIFRTPIAGKDEGMVVSLFGCRAESTLSTCEFLENEFKKVTREIKDIPLKEPLLILLSMQAKGKTFEDADIMLIATPERKSFVKKNNEEIVKYEVQEK